jgi:hypothetical protein
MNTLKFMTERTLSENKLSLCAMKMYGGMDV